MQEVHGGSTSTFLDIHTLVQSGGEEGLLSMAFPPDYATSGLFYVYYTAPLPGDSSGDMLTIEEFHATSPDAADPASGRIVLTQAHPNFGNHNGGQLQFGPDGYLYAGTGDGGSGGDPKGNGQNLNSPLGKLLRIDPHPSGGNPYTVPPGNPFAGMTGDRPEIWAYGLRNPWRYSFDRATGDLVIGDVGQNLYEEIDYVARPAGASAAAGANFGWNCFEGTHPYDLSPPCNAPPTSYVAPVHDYGHVNGQCSITGGYVVRDPNLASIAGRYLYADFCAGELRSIALTNPLRRSRRGDQRAQPLVLRRGRLRAAVRRLAQRSRLPARCVGAGRLPTHHGRSRPRDRDHGRWRCRRRRSPPPARRCRRHPAARSCSATPSSGQRAPGGIALRLPLSGRLLRQRLRPRGGRPQAAGPWSSLPGRGARTRPPSSACPRGACDSRQRETRSCHGGCRSPSAAGCGACSPGTWSSAPGSRSASASRAHPRRRSRRSSSTYVELPLTPRPAHNSENPASDATRLGTACSESARTDTARRLPPPAA